MPILHGRRRVRRPGLQGGRPPCCRPTRSAGSPGLQIADQPFVGIMRTNPKPEIAAIVEGGQCANAGASANRPKIRFDFLETQGF